MALESLLDAGEQNRNTSSILDFLTQNSMPGQNIDQVPGSNQELHVYMCKSQNIFFQRINTHKFFKKMRFRCSNSKRGD